jgi:hypothetical protein
MTDTPSGVHVPPRSTRIGMPGRSTGLLVAALYATAWLPAFRPSGRLYRTSLLSL